MSLPDEFELPDAARVSEVVSHSGGILAASRLHTNITKLIEIISEVIRVSPPHVVAKFDEGRLSAYFDALHLIEVALARKPATDVLDIAAKCRVAAPLIGDGRDTLTLLVRSIFRDMEAISSSPVSQPANTTHR